MRLETAVKKVARIEKHLEENPADYESVVSLFKTRSKVIEAARRRRQNERLKKVAEWRKKLG